jgi:hypothetical protein
METKSNRYASKAESINQPAVLDTMEKQQAKERESTKKAHAVGQGVSTATAKTLMD